MDYKELSVKSEAELRKELAEMREQAAQLLVKIRMQQAKNTHSLKGMRRDIARIMTALAQKTAK